MENYELSTLPVEHHFGHLNHQEKAEKSSFIEANTVSTTFNEMRKEHIIPVFVKDNEPLISHVDFIASVLEELNSCFPEDDILDPSIRVSHPIKGRVPEAKNKPAEDLLPWEKTLYYERMMFTIEIPTIKGYIEEDSLSLTVGGVKAYNQDNLYSRNQSEQHFKLFVGFQNKVCTNLCVWTDGLMSDIRVKDKDTLKMYIHHLLERYRRHMHLETLNDLANYSISESQFAQLIGKCRMFQHLPEHKKSGIKPILLGDQQIGTVARDYYKDNSFCRNGDGSINLWRLYNLLTGANKSTYIDQFLERSANAYDFVEHIKWSLIDRRDNWYVQQ